MKKEDTPMNVGRIVRIVGPVVDIEFPADAIPAIYNALKVDVETPLAMLRPLWRFRRIYQATSYVLSPCRQPTACSAA